MSGRGWTRSSASEARLTPANRDDDCPNNTPRPPGTPLERGLRLRVQQEIPSLRGVARSDGVCRLGNPLTHARSYMFYAS